MTFVGLAQFQVGGTDSALLGPSPSSNLAWPSCRPPRDIRLLPGFRKMRMRHLTVCFVGPKGSLQWCLGALPTIREGGRVGGRSQKQSQTNQRPSPFTTFYHVGPQQPTPAHEANRAQKPIARAFRVSLPNWKEGGTRNTDPVRPLYTFTAG